MEKDRKKSVLFICNHNSARSQMAEGLLRKIYGKFYKVFSAGLSSSEINPLTYEVMEEIGIDMSNHRSKGLEEFKDKEVDIVVTVCHGAQEACPIFLGGKKYIHKGFKDPSNFKGTEKEKIIQFREIRDEIKEWIRKEFYPDN
ncbi:MAG: arsenate reductase ArsC [Methanobacteriaceae archaeon]|nr:arsenate reductase ArsC [Methanobacteriaceae archaeon]